MRSLQKLLLVTLFGYAACKNPDNGHLHSNDGPASPPIINWSVKRQLPHDTSLFTEGFVVHEGKIFESTGSPEQYANAESLVGIIDPSTGQVVGRLDLHSIVADAMNKNPYANVLNGIAYDPATDRIYVVGKRWPAIYQIDFPH